MHIKNLLILIFSFLVTFSGFSQKKVKFSMSFSPEKIYLQTQNSEITNTIKFNGSKEVLHELKMKGLENPTVQVQKSKKTSTIQTGKLNENTGEFPITIDMNKIESDNPNDKIVEGIKLHGHGYEDKAFEIDSVSNTEMPDNAKEVFVATFDNVMKQLNFHGRTLKIGESFTQTSPLQIPVGNGSVIKLEVTITYTLTDVKDNEAYFKSEEKYKMMLTDGEMNISGGGSGGGTVIYDLNHNYYLEYHNLSTINLSMKMEELTMNFEMVNKVDNIIKIKDQE